MASIVRTAEFVAEAVVRAVHGIAQTAADQELLGLRAFPEYFQRSVLSLPAVDGSWEPWITLAVADCLFRSGIPAFAEVKYPVSTRTSLWCDLVVPLGSTDFMWIECKCAFAKALKPLEEGGISVDYSGRLTRAGRWQQSLRGVHEDVTKLERLKRPEASAVGILLIVLDDSARPLDLFNESSPLPSCLANWREVHQETKGMVWDDLDPRRRALGFRESCRCWYRAVDG